MNDQIDPIDDVCSPRKGRTAGRVGGATLSRLSNLIEHLHQLQESTRSDSSGRGGENSLDAVIDRLESMRGRLIAETAASGWPEEQARPFAMQNAVTDKPIGQFVARLVAKCRACGRSACGLYLRAQSSGTRMVAFLAYQLTRELERLFWVLRLYAQRRRVERSANAASRSRPNRNGRPGHFSSMIHLNC